jgi:hypothetical protein
MNIRNRIFCGLLWLSAVPLWAQVDNTIPVPAVTGVQSNDDRMTTPPPVSGADYPVRFTSETPANYLRGGLTFDSAYSDNVLTSAAGNPLGDLSFSIWPTIAIDQTRPRLHWRLSYAPGFTFYRRFDSRNEADQNVALDFEYQLTPHLTLTLRDAFQESSSAFNSPDQSLTGAVSGSAQGSNNLVVAPLTERLYNNGNAGITYQFAPNGMVGASGTFTNLHYPNPAEVSGTNPAQGNPAQLFGLYDASSRTGSAFSSVRFSKKHYIGVAYQYDDLFSFPTGLTTETRTQSVFLFYTFYATPAFSVSLFGGPQYSRTSEITQPASQMWSPTGGASLNWQARRTAVALSGSHIVSGGGGLIGAAESDMATLSVRQKIAKNLSAALDGAYANRTAIPLVSLPNMNGHSISGDVSLERRVGQHFAARAGYTRLRQRYDDVVVISPNTNREWVSISYEFTRPLGR